MNSKYHNPFIVLQARTKFMEIAKLARLMSRVNLIVNLRRLVPLHVCDCGM